MTPQEQIERLQAENESLKARLVAAGLMPPHVELPSDKQIDTLLKLVAATHPRLARPDCINEDELPIQRRHFAAALHSIAFAQRADKLDSTYGASWHCDQTNRWLARFGLGRTSLRTWCAAAVASGVRVSASTDWPSGFELALVPLGELPRPIAGWSAVLKNGIAPPLELRRPVQPAPNIRVQRDPARDFVGFVDGEGRW